MVKRGASKLVNDTVEHAARQDIICALVNIVIETSEEEMSD